jgi:dimeric dUTPase (all-alpha-NTP-PPase superfamily)
MNIEKLLKKQSELDKMILNKKKITHYPYAEIRLALLVELGELANEVQSFKYWKDNKNINRDKILEEYADCLHFALSLENYLNECNSYDINIVAFKNKDMDSITMDLVTCFRRIIDTSDILEGILQLGGDLGFNEKEIEKAYLDKHEINYERQRRGY